MRLPARLDDGRGPVDRPPSRQRFGQRDRRLRSDRHLGPEAVPVPGSSQRLYEEDLPQLAVEEITHRFQVDMAAILLDNAGEVQTMGSVGLRRAGPARSTVGSAISSRRRPARPQAGRPRRAVVLSGTASEATPDSLALVPLIRDQVGFGVLLAGRRPEKEHRSTRARWRTSPTAPAISSYVWAWLLLRNLKLAEDAAVSREAVR